MEEEWSSTKEIADFLRKNMEITVGPDIIAHLAKKGKIKASKDPNGKWLIKPNYPEIRKAIETRQTFK